MPLNHEKSPRLPVEAFLADARNAQTAGARKGRPYR